MWLFKLLIRIWQFRPVFVTVLALVLLLPIIYEIDDDVIPLKPRKCLYILAVMAISWVTEAVPISVTALYPLVLFPLWGVMKASDTASAYMSDTTMLFLGGLIVAVAVEEWNLHKRIAMAVMLFVGSDPKLIMAGLMLPTWFLSMWISNTATASMMIPIAAAVLAQMKSTEEELPPAMVMYAIGPNQMEGGNDNPAFQGEQLNVPSENPPPYNGNHSTKESKESESSPASASKGEQLHAIPAPQSNGPTQPRVVQMSREQEEKRFQRISKGLTLCIAYAANIGGIATLTGTPPNLVLRGAANQLYESYSDKTQTSPISFANWMGMAVPLSLLTLVLGYLLLVLFFLTGRGCTTQNRVQSTRIKTVIRQEWNRLGTITFAEIVLMCLFVLLAVLWLSRDPKESPGWNVWFESGYPSDATSAMLIALLLFILPAKVPNIFCWESAAVGERFYTPLLTWENVHKKVPWGVIVLLGGGFSLAKGVRESGLAEWLAIQLATLDWMDTWVLNLVLCLIVAAFTEVTSNTATAQILMPIMAQLAISLGVNPLYFMASTCIATSFAFMLPVATPPNAIVFSFGSIKVIDMCSVGIFMNLIAVACLTLCVNTWGDAIYDLKTLDPLFNATKTT